MATFVVGRSKVGSADRVGGDSGWVDGPAKPPWTVIVGRRASTSDVRLYLTYRATTTGTPSVVAKLDQITLRMATAAHGTFDKTFDFATDAMGMVDLGTNASIAF